MTQRVESSGLLYGVAAYGLWGMMPFYFHAVDCVPSGEILGQRICWSAFLLILLVSVLGRWPIVRAALTHPRHRSLLFASSLFIAINWYVYIYGVSTGRVVQTSLGYFINPLFNILLGMVFFRERLRVGQWGAVLLAAAGLAYLVWSVGELPWIALTVAGSFGLYGLTRKVAPVDALTGLAAESFILAPLALGWLIYLASTGEMVYRGDRPTVNFLLLISGVITAVPLICFAIAAKRLPLSILGFVQYLAPSIQFLIGVFIFGEPFRPAQWVGFGCIWAALLILTAESLWSMSRRGPNSIVDPTSVDEALVPSAFVD